MSEKINNNFKGFDDSNIEEEQERLVNRNKKYKSQKRKNDKKQIKELNELPPFLRKKMKTK